MGNAAEVPGASGVGEVMGWVQGRSELERDRTHPRTSLEELCVRVVAAALALDALFGKSLSNEKQTK